MPWWGVLVIFFATLAIQMVIFTCFGYVLDGVGPRETLTRSIMTVLILSSMVATGVICILGGSGPYDSSHDS